MFLFSTLFLRKASIMSLGVIIPTGLFLSKITVWLPWAEFSALTMFLTDSSGEIVLTSVIITSFKGILFNELIAEGFPDFFFPFLEKPFSLLRGGRSMKFFKMLLKEIIPVKFPLSSITGILLKL